MLKLKYIVKGRSYIMRYYFSSFLTLQKLNYKTESPRPSHREHDYMETQGVKNDKMASTKKTNM